MKDNNFLKENNGYKQDEKAIYEKMENFLNSLQEKLKKFLQNFPIQDIKLIEKLEDFKKLPRKRKELIVYNNQDKLEKVYLEFDEYFNPHSAYHIVSTYKY